MQHKLRVLFWLRKNKLNSNNEAAIYCRITVNGKRANDFSTNVITQPQFWDSKKQKIKNDDNKQMLLDLLKHKLTSIYVDLEMKDVSVTANHIQKLYTKKPDHNKSDQTFEQLFHEYYSGEVIAGNKYTFRTQVHYKSRFEAIIKFMTETQTDKLNINEIKPRFADELSDWLQLNKKYSPNYAVKVIGIAKQVFKYAMKKEYVLHNPFLFVKIKRRQKPLVVLSKEELHFIMNYRFASERLQEVADLFLIQCFTGMAYVDLMAFEKTRINNGFICFNRQKTESESLIPVLPETLILLEKYNYLLPKISNQKYNAYIKEVVEITGIKKELTTHAGRKTCGSILLNEGVSIEVVSRILGHKDTKITQHIYARVNELRITREMSSLDLFPTNPVSFIKKFFNTIKSKKMYKP